MKELNTADRFLAARIKVVWPLALVMLLLPGCGRKDSPGPKAPPAPAADTATQSQTAEPGKSASETTALPEPSKDGLKKLCGDTNPYIRNNARQGLASWDAKDYTGAVIAMQKIISLCNSPSQQADAFSSLAQLKTEIAAAVAKGNRNAKEAAAQLEQITR